MSSITIALPEEQMQQLHERAEAAGVTPEELLSAGVQEWLSSSDHDFASAVAFVLNKNAELYRRLA